MGVLTPRDTSEDALEEAVARFRSALSDDAVLTGEAELKEFRDPYTFASWDQHWASAVVMPETVEQVQEVIRIANELGVPVWTSSQGRNNAYGGAAPVLHGAVQINLRRMNRVLEVNEELGYAVVEPGVSFEQFYEHLQKIGSKLWPQIPDIGWGSVIGNTVDHGIGNTAPGQHADRACGLEVVLANGELLRTGMGAMPGSTAWHAYKRGFGPALDSLFMQSNFGIVTKMGVWCMAEPETYKLCLINTEDNSIVPDLLDRIRPFVIDNTILAGMSFSKYLDTAEMIGIKEAMERGEYPRDEALQVIRKRNISAPWCLRFPLYGPSEVVEAHWRRIQKAFSDLPGLEFSDRTFAGADVHTQTVNHMEMCSAGVPNRQLLVWLDLQPGDAGHLDFSPVAALDGAAAVKLMDTVRPIFEDLDLPYNPTFNIVGRMILHLVPTAFDTQDEEEVDRVFNKLFPRLLQACAENGFGLYRTHIHFMDAVQETFSYNNHIMRRFLETIKDAVDPKGILSPGKSGIWPQRLRPEREHDGLA